MTKKDYELIAGAISFAVDKYDGEDWTMLGAGAAIAGLIADELAEDNPRFNREMFLKACGVAL